MKFDPRKLLSALFVSEYNCLFCGRELAGKTRYAVCSNCYQKQEVIERGCLKCGKLLVTEAEYCLDCQENEKGFDVAVAPFAYSAAIPNLVMDLKFNNKRYLAPYMARFMTDKFLDRGLTASVVVPVPLHKNREKKRGYNQSALLASEIAKGLNLPYLPSVASRVKDTLTSSTLEGGRKAREENMKDAFVINDPSAVKNKLVLIVDDVLTTGSTSGELARALKKAGATRVVALTFATTKEKPPVQKEEAPSIIDLK